MNRNEIIQTIYRSLRDAIDSPVKYVERKNNSVVFDTENERATVSFRIKLEKLPTREKGF